MPLFDAFLGASATALLAWFLGRPTALTVGLFVAFMTVFLVLGL